VTGGVVVSAGVRLGTPRFPAFVSQLMVSVPQLLYGTSPLSCPALPPHHYGQGQGQSKRHFELEVFESSSAEIAGLSNQK